MKGIRRWSVLLFAPPLLGGWQPNAAARNLSAARAEAVGLVIARDPATLGIEPFYMKFIAGLESSPNGQSEASSTSASAPAGG